MLLKLPCLQTVSALLGLALVMLLTPPASAAPAPAPTVADPILTALVLGKIGALSLYAIENGVFDSILDVGVRSRSASARSSRPIVPGPPLYPH